MTTLGNVTIRTKISVGFAIVLALLLTIGVIGYLSISSALNSFSEYRQLARSSNAIGRVQANMLMTRMNAKTLLLGEHLKRRRRLLIIRT